MALSPCNTTTDLHQRELVEHGSLFFPIGCYPDDMAVVRVPWHWHEEFEYAIATEGSPVIFVESTQIRLEPGQGIFINSGVLHAVDTPVANTAEIHSAVFHPRLISGNRDSVFWEKLVQPLLRDSALRYVVLRPEVPWQCQILDCFRQSWDAVVEETEDFENDARYLISKALGVLSRNCPVISQSLSEQERIDAGRVRAMLEFIDANYPYDLTVEQIADSVSVSSSVCLRCFRQLLGTTPMQYVKKLRLEKAAELLKTTAKTAKEIAMECGFNDVSYFTKAFREKMGCTPKEFQKSHTRRT